MSSNENIFVRGYKSRLFVVHSELWVMLNGIIKQIYSKNIKVKTGVSQSLEYENSVWVGRGEGLLSSLVKTRNSLKTFGI